AAPAPPPPPHPPRRAPPPPPPPPATPSRLVALRASSGRPQGAPSTESPPEAQGARRKIFIRTEEEQFALPLSKVETNNDLVELLSRLFSPELLHRLQIRYDWTSLDDKGNVTGPIGGGAVIYPEYWESLVEDGMRIVVRVLPEDDYERPAEHVDTATIAKIHEISEQLKNNLSYGADGPFDKFLAKPAHAIAAPAGLPSTKENNARTSPRYDVGRGQTYSAVVKQQGMQPLGLSSALDVNAMNLPKNVLVDNKKLNRLVLPPHLDRVELDKKPLLPVRDPYSFTYQSCITMLGPLLPEWRRITHPRLSPNIVTIRPCHENTLWIFCVVQQTLHPVTVRAFETIDIEELVMRVVPAHVGKERTVVLWRNMKFGGEDIGERYNAKKETRGTGARNMWKRNLAVLAVKNAEVFVVVWE
ncbi:uncharacterized protein V1510DRAFT_434997, partial [Dipodascopsis tothii]|uniref:uncharacterized protein n=1 Tax=Dipodascopsis tothii TaxID=44089 RepID=UPI0034CFC1E5